MMLINTERRQAKGELRFSLNSDAPIQKLVLMSISAINFASMVDIQYVTILHHMYFCYFNIVKEK